MYGSIPRQIPCALPPAARQRAAGFTLSPDPCSVAPTPDLVQGSVSGPTRGVPIGTTSRQLPFGNAAFGTQTRADDARTHTHQAFFVIRGGQGGGEILEEAGTFSGQALLLSYPGGGGGPVKEAGTNSPPCPQYLQLSK